MRISTKYDVIEFANKRLKEMNETKDYNLAGYYLEERMNAEFYIEDMEKILNILQAPFEL